VTLRLTSTVTVTGVEERFRTVHLSGVGDKSITAERSTGWWIVLDNKLALCVGIDKPPYQIGDKLRWILE
jgi:hypothetical protein